MEEKTTIEKLQSLPYQTRVKILWLSVAVVGVVLVFALVQSIKSSVEGAGENLIQFQSETTTPEGQNKFASVERVERTNSVLKIYFNLNNTTNDILNAPVLTSIKLKAGEENLNPQKITDRQGNPFVQKVLSQTQNFGILIFPATTATETTLILDQMSFEKSPTNVFKQSLELNLEELSKNTEVRN